MVVVIGGGGLGGGGDVANGGLHLETAGYHCVMHRKYTHS